MATLHTVNKSPFEQQTLEQCLDRAVKGASILLIEDGVVAAVRGTRLEQRLTSASQSLEIFVLEPDIQARGLANYDLIEGVRTVDYNGFVELVVTHERVHCWL